MVCAPDYMPLMILWLQLLLHKTPLQAAIAILVSASVDGDVDVCWPSPFLVLHLTVYESVQTAALSRVLQWLAGTLSG